MERGSEAEKLQEVSPPNSSVCGQAWSDRASKEADRIDPAKSIAFVNRLTAADLVAF
jgi:hypothetical protein